MFASQKLLQGLLKLIRGGLTRALHGRGHEEFPEAQLVLIRSQAQLAELPVEHLPGHVGQQGTRQGAIGGRPQAAEEHLRDPDQLREEGSTSRQNPLTFITPRKAPEACRKGPRILNPKPNSALGLKGLHHHIAGTVSGWCQNWDSCGCLKETNNLIATFPRNKHANRIHWKHRCPFWGNRWPWLVEPPGKPGIHLYFSTKSTKKDWRTLTSNCIKVRAPAAAAPGRARHPVPPPAVPCLGTPGEWAAATQSIGTVGVAKSICFSHHERKPWLKPWLVDICGGIESETRVSEWRCEMDFATIHGISYKMPKAINLRPTHWPKPWFQHGLWLVSQPGHPEMRQVDPI